MGLKLRFHNGAFVMCQFPPDTAVPATVLAHPLTVFMRTRDEMTLICPAALAPAGAKQETGWVMLEFIGPFAFDLTGILTQVAVPLAAAGIEICALTSFSTDFILIKEAKRDLAVKALIAAGHSFVV